MSDAGQGGAVVSGAGQGGAVVSGAGQGSAVVSDAVQGGAVVSGAGQGGAVVSGAGQGGAVVSGAGQGGAVVSLVQDREGSTLDHLPQSSFSLCYSLNPCESQSLFVSVTVFNLSVRLFHSLSLSDAATLVWTARAEK